MRRTILRTILIVGLSILTILAASGYGTVWAQSAITVTTLDTIRLRAKPNLKADIVTSIPIGTTLPAISRDDSAQWIKVNYQNQYGWLNIYYLKINGNLSTLPVGDIVPAAAAGSTPPPPADGTIATLDVYTTTLHAIYYRLSYWSDGLKIIGWLAIPKQKFKQFPAVIYNRGGSNTGGFVTPVELAPFAETGYVVVASQYRGAAGSQGHDEFGGADVDDVTSLIPLLKNIPNVDGNRIGMFGTSRGGMMTYLALKRQSQSGAKDIKVAATVSGLTDLIMWAEERSDLNSAFYPGTIGATTLTDPEAFKARSATYWAGAIRTPLLIEHGDGDDQVSVAQAQKLYSQMGARGGACKLIIYPGDDHGLHNNEGGYRAAMQWFQKYLAAPGEDLTFETHADDITYAYLILRHR